MEELFTTTEINGMELENRFVRAATWERMAEQKGHLTDDLVEVYKKLAQAEIGLIITGYAYVTEEEQPNPGMMGIYEDSFIDEYKKLTDLVHQEGSKIVMQLAYGGSKTSFKPDEREILGPSAVPHQKTGVTPKKMSEEDINYIINSYADAAERAKEAGFDGVQIHAGHSYLLNQFLSPYHNQRTDRYGGSLENRARFILEIYQEIRDRVGSDYPILVKVSPGDFVEGGQTFADSLSFCKLLDQKGIDLIEVSGNIHSSAEEYFEEEWYGHNIQPDAYFKEYAEKIAEEVSSPIMLVGGLRKYEVVEDLFQESKIDYFSFCRPLMAEADLIKRWKKGDRSPAKCTSCSQCYTEKGNICIFNRN